MRIAIHASTSLNPETSTALDLPNPDGSSLEMDVPAISGEAASVAAVNRCIEAYNRAYKAVMDAGGRDYQATTAAGSAYRKKMPPLSCRQTIRNFIACVAHGLLLDAINGVDASRLLYAAQIAHAASEIPQTQRQPGRPPHSASQKTAQTELANQ